MHYDPYAYESASESSYPDRSSKGTTMWHASEQVTIAASPDAVWQVVADIEDHARLAGSGEIRAIRVAGPVAAGMVFEGDIAAGEVGTFVSCNVIETCEARGARAVLERTDRIATVHDGMRRTPANIRGDADAR